MWLLRKWIGNLINESNGKALCIFSFSLLSVTRVEPFVMNYYIKCLMLFGPPYISVIQKSRGEKNMRGWSFDLDQCAPLTDLVQIKWPNSICFIQLLLTRARGKGKMQPLLQTPFWRWRGTRVPLWDVFEFFLILTRCALNKAII